MSDFMKLARSRGLVPDWAWYQINGKSAQENWVEQRQKMTEQQEPDTDIQVFFTSGVRVK